MRSARVDYEQFFLAHLPLIDRIVRGVGRRYRLSPEEVEDLTGAVHAKLIDRDYDALRRFEQRSQISTYLTAIVVRHMLDQRNRRWGKWRPSEEAKRRGRVAMMLEELMRRDGQSFDQAVEILKTNRQVQETPAELYEIAQTFPTRTPRRFVGDEELDSMPAPAEADDAVEAQERALLASRVRSALVSVLSGLAAQDQLLVKMLFRDAMQIAQVARLLKLEPKPLYRRVELIRRRLRRALEALGVTREDVLTVIGVPTVPWDESLRGEGEGDA